MELLLRGERLLLLPERAVFWPARKTILLSDVHWGKSAHFRKNGIPMPGGTQEDDALRLAKIIRDHGAERMIVAGDFFHSKHNKEVEDFGRWRTAHSSLHIDFILGNHDILPLQAYKSWDLQVHEEQLLEPPFLIIHDAPEAAGIDCDPNDRRFTIHGHIHPGVKLQGLGRQAFTLPAFCVSDTCIILPAFGKFTGCKLVNSKDYKGIYVIGDGKVMKWK